MAFPEQGDRRKIVSFSDYHMTCRAKLLRHVLWSNNDDPLRQISFLPHSATRVELRESNMEREGAVLGHFNYDELMYEDNMIYAAAQRRDF